MEDKRAHERITGLEEVVTKHLESHVKFEASIQTIADNTSELVTLVKGAKGLQKFILWAMPFAVAGGALWAWIKAH